MFQPPKGTRDFLPKEAAKRRFYFEKVRQVLESFGYGEVITPSFETIDLLEAKGAIGGEAVKDVFRIFDKGKDKLGYGLIFDPTTPIARLIASDKSLRLPVKWYYIRPMWRYEEVKPGRYREFWQGGAEFIGSADPAADAEILALTYFSIKAVGIKDFTMRVNSRKIIESLAKLAGIPDGKKAGAFRAIDKLDKFGETEVRGEMERYEIPKKAIDAFLSLVKKDAEELRKELKNDRKALENLDEIIQIIGYAKKMGVDCAKIDFSVIRGIDYYTGFIFETLVKGNEKLGSIASGGRYDKLIEIYGGAPTPATGVGIGIDRMMEILPDQDYWQARILVVSVNDSVKEKAVDVTAILRKAGVPADMDYSGKPLRKQFEAAAATNIPFLVIVGPKELEKKSVKVRDMKSGKEKDVAIAKLAEEFL